MTAYTKEFFTQFAPSSLAVGDANQWRYQDTTNTLATMEASGFFDATEDSTNLFALVQVNDLIYIIGSNGADWVRVTSIADPVTVTTVTDVVSGASVAAFAPASTTAGIPVLYSVTTPGGATATTSIVVAQKITVIDAWIVNQAAGGASDTLQIKNGSTALTDAMDANKSANVITRAATIDPAQRVINAGGTLAFTETDGAGSNSPAISCYVLGYITA